MGLEAGSFIEDLVVANPPGSDGKSQGDDHLRLLKTVIKATFPLATAARKFGSADAGATDVLAWLLHRNSASPAANDLLGSYAVSGESSTSVERVYARLQAQIISATNGDEEGAWRFLNMVNGVEAEVAKFESAGINFAFPLIGAGKPPTNQDFAFTGVNWTRPVGCRFVIVEACGGGGGSGAVNGQGAGTAGSSGGGGGGWSGMTELIDVSADALRLVTLGAAGAAGATPSGNGGDGGITSINLGGTIWQWAGGQGSNGFVANSSLGSTSTGARGGDFTNVRGHSQNGSMGNSEATAGAGNFTGGDGGSSNFGRGGKGAHDITLANTPGDPGDGFGTGGGGSGTINTAGDAPGRAGTAGFMRIWEFY